MSAQIIQFPAQGQHAVDGAFFDFAVNELNHWREPEDETASFCQRSVLSVLWLRWATDEGVDEYARKPDFDAIANRIFRYNARYMAHWSDHHQHMFDHLVRDGRSAEEATAHIESEIRDQQDAEALPESERLLFLARRAMQRMKPIKH